jgi:S-adenosylmethionine:tRNA ribosyltransferase-isomerase
LVADFDYQLPPELIAQVPAPRRDESRMLVLERKTGALRDMMFRDILTLLGSSDLLVLNDTKVIPARIYGLDPEGRKVELLLLRELEPGLWEALSRPSRKAKVGVRLSYGEEWAEILEWGAAGVRKVRFSTQDVIGLLNRKGEVPLPPYIRMTNDEVRMTNDEARTTVDNRNSSFGNRHWLWSRYQTVYARQSGAVAAPTAGLHFTDDVLNQLRAQGVVIAYVTLHAGLGTFRPVKAETVEEHTMYQEELEITPENAELVNAARSSGRRAVAAGTTVARALEARAFRDGSGNWLVKPGHCLTDLFIKPGYQFRIIDALLTNFHLPRSTLLMLVSAFASREMILHAYEHAIAEKYRFYSFGDAMVIV